MAIKISYIPERGMITNYYDCEAIAPDGSRWKAASGRWHQLASAPEKSRDRLKQPANSAAPMFGAFGFFISMTLFAKPVFMSFPEPSVALPVLGAICCTAAAAFYRISK